MRAMIPNEIVLSRIDTIIDMLHSSLIEAVNDTLFEISDGDLKCIFHDIVRSVIEHHIELRAMVDGYYHASDRSSSTSSDAISLYEQLLSKLDSSYNTRSECDTPPLLSVKQQELLTTFLTYTNLLIIDAQNAFTEIVVDIHIAHNQDLTFTTVADESILDDGLSPIVIEKDKEEQQGSRDTTPRIYCDGIDTRNRTDYDSEDYDGEVMVWDEEDIEALFIIHNMVIPIHNDTGNSGIVMGGISPITQIQQGPPPGGIPYDQEPSYRTDALSPAHQDDSSI